MLSSFGRCVLVCDDERGLQVLEGCRARGCRAGGRAVVGVDNDDLM